MREPGTSDAELPDMRILLAAFLLAHGVAHIVWFFGAWAPTRTTIVGNRVDLGASWIKLVGLLWLLGTITFSVAAVATLANASWWPAFTMGLAGASLTLCILQLPQTRFGVVLNIVLIAALIGGQHVGWF